MSITEITPRGGIAGSVITINGSAFGNAEGTITLAGIPATQIAFWSDIQIVFTTPSGTSTDGAYVCRVVRADLSLGFEELFWIPAIDPFTSDLDYQLPNTETGPTQNQDLPRRAEAALFNRIIDLARSGGAGGGTISVSSGPSGDPDEVQVSGVSKIRFLTKYLPGEDHFVISRPNGEIYVGGITPPDTLQGKVLTGQPTVVVGRLSDLNVNYKGADPAGDQVNYITRGVALTMTTPDGASSWSYASLGNLILNINGFDVANIDLNANFSEPNRALGQVIGNYNTIGTGDPISGGVVTFTGGTLNLLSVQPTQGIDTDDFQRGQADIILAGAALRQGYNTVTLRHAPASTYTATTVEFFWDQDTAGGGNDPAVSATALTENTPTFKVLSGISYYGAGSTFSLSTLGARLLNNVYEQDELPLLVSGFPGVASVGINVADASVVGPSVPPAIGESMSVSNYPIVVPVGQQANDARVTVTPRDPYGSYTTEQSPSQNFTIMSAADSSTNTEEFFQDENYRFPLTTPSFDLVPGSLTGNFTSATSLLDVSRTKELQVYNHTTGSFKNQLIHPFFNFTSSFKPLGNPSYAPLSPNTSFQYVRVFKAPSDKSSGILSVPGLTDVDINNALLSNVLIDIKVPGKTVWLSLNKPFTLSTFNLGASFVTGTNGEGCRINSGVDSPNINGQIGFTLGSYFTGASTNQTLFIRITYTHNAIPRVINGSGPGMSVVDW